MYFLSRSDCGVIKEITILFITYEIIYYERVTGIEPVSHPWKGRVEPFNYTRLN
jgi:hypothetical protein